MIKKQTCMVAVCCLNLLALKLPLKLEIIKNISGKLNKVKVYMLAHQMMSTSNPFEAMPFLMHT
jgi:hypothetical protein